MCRFADTKGGRRHRRNRIEKRNLGVHPRVLCGHYELGHREARRETTSKVAYKEKVGKKTVTGYKTKTVITVLGSASFKLKRARRRPRSFF
jgi:hypothetical protein